MTMWRNWMLLSTGVLVVWTAQGFTTPSNRLLFSSSTTPTTTSTSLDMGMSRKARRQMDRQEKKKKKKTNFREAVDQLEPSASASTATTEGESPAGSVPPDEDAAETPKGGLSEGSYVGNNNVAAEEMQRRIDDRPEISSVYIDDETGFEMIRQGRNVMDIISRQAIQLSDLGPDYRLAQMFPGVPMDIRQAYRYNWATCEVPEMVAAFKEACLVKLEDGSRGFPPKPSISNKAIDFVLANRDLMGNRFKRTLGRLMMRAAWQEDTELMTEYRNLLDSFLILENYISAPFRQMIMNAEVKVGPNFGNLDLMSYCNGDLYERTANYLVLKGMQCTWEKKVRDAEYVESKKAELGDSESFRQVIGVGDPRRYEPETDVIYLLKECVQVCTMAQRMVQTYVETPALFDDLPVEVRFVEKALSIKGGTALRKYIAEEFCPQEGITPEALREGVRRLLQQIDNMYLDPYADIRNVLHRLTIAMAVGTDSARDPYEDYEMGTNSDSPGYFQTYTFNLSKLSIAAFLDINKYGRSMRSGNNNAVKKVRKERYSRDLSFFGKLFEKDDDEELEEERQARAQLMADAEDEDYIPPAERAIDRPHDLGWLDVLNTEISKEPDFKDVQPGRIIFED